MVKRRLMEAQGSGEARRLHIIYFLSRKAYIEHLHLIRIHHLSRNGVRLRDIKRWLGELRGKDMPESFSWLYKRRYKTGYVWQDLVDDDLITPISDNEYVLKGSEISSNTNNTEFLLNEEEIPLLKEQSSIQGAAADNKTTRFKEDKQSPSSETSIIISTRSSSEIDESSPNFGSETPLLTYDSTKPEIYKNSVTKEQEKQKGSLSLFRSKSKKVKINGKLIGSKAASADELHFAKSKSCSHGASHMFRNLITCGAVDSNDSAVVPSGKQSRSFFSMCSCHQKDVCSAVVCKREKPGDSQMVFGTCYPTQHQWSNSKSCDGLKASPKKKGEFREQRVRRAACKPLNGPNCSQCGKSFKPEKMHAHMKSCKGKKLLANTSNPTISAENASKISAEFKNQDSASAYFLTY